MVKIYPFKAVRPVREEAGNIASVPYDVVSTEEAKEIIENQPQSFMRVIRSEATLPGVDPASPEVYDTASRNLKSLMDKGLLVQDGEPGIYLYRIKQGESIYLGFVSNVSVDDYRADRIKKHEHTRYDKEEDRTKHIDTTNANTGLVVLLYRDSGDIYSYIDSLVPEGNPDAVARDGSGVVHEVFRISDPQILTNLEEMFAGVDSFYIADGHHRAKSSVNVADKRESEGRMTPESDRFMAVIFAENRVKIHGYSRLVTDLGSYNPETFMTEIKTRFDVREYGEINERVFRIPPLKDSKTPVHTIHMYLAGKWYELSAPVKNPEDVIGSLDVSVLQKEVMEDMLGITDPRKDPRLQYLGGARPLADLKGRVDSGAFKVAFSLQPVKVETVLSVADEGNVMPPKSTWFEPKLLSGLVIHTLD